MISQGHDEKLFHCFPGLKPPHGLQDIREVDMDIAGASRKIRDSGA
jgi:hypothetical protein